MHLNGTGDLFERHEFPATSAELVEAYGDRVIELQSGTETVGEVLARLEDETYDGPRDAAEAVRSAVSHKAIGRRFYSDRDAPTPADAEPTQISF